MRSQKNYFLHAMGIDYWVLRQNSPPTKLAKRRLLVVIESAATQLGQSGQLLQNMLVVLQIQVIKIISLKNSEMLSSLLFAKELLGFDLGLLFGIKVAQSLLVTSDPWVTLRQQVHYLTDQQIPIIVTEEPNYLLAHPQEKAKVWTDLKKCFIEQKKWL